MTTANYIKEESIAKEIASFVVAKRQPEVRANELESIFQELGYGEKELGDFLTYIQTSEGKDFFRKTIRMELWKAGYRPRGWEL